MSNQLPPYFITCSNCKRQNELFRHNCSNCGSVLDNRYPNLDLWTTIARLIDSPIEAFKGIVRAENKNFVFLLLLFLALRFISIGGFLSAFVLHNSTPLLHGFFVIPVYLSAVYLVYVILGKSLARQNAEVRFADIIAGSVYAALPLYFSGTFLFLLEYIFFGKYMFMTTPNVFMINDVVAWLFIGMESLLIIYYLFLLYSFFRIYKQRIVLPALLAVLLAGLTFFIYVFTLTIYG